MSAEIHVGDTGTVFERTVKDQDGDVVDIGANTELTFTFMKPDNTTTEKDGTMVGDGSTGKVKYTTLATDLDQPGTWSYQLFVQLPGGGWNSDILEFDVEPNLPEPAGG